MLIKIKTTPSWWHGKNVADRLVSGALRPVSRLYGWVAKHNFNRRDAYVSKLPVICIGNFTSGGAGKTPLTLAVIHILQEMGEKPVVLSRGYGGKMTGPYQVNTETDTSADVGDEPLMLAHYTAVVISANRAKGAQAIEQGEGTVIVMDDGFQNNSLSKDLSLVVVDGKTGIGNGHVIPSGPLRAPWNFQIPLADGVIVNGAGEMGQNVAKKAQSHGLPVLQAQIKMDEERAQWLKNKKVIAFTGIGRPSKFYDMLKHYGSDLVDTVDFPDHHQFSQEEAALLLEKASQTDETFLVTTQKDAMRLAKGKGALQWLRYEAEVIAVTMAFEQPEKLHTMIEEMLTQKRRS